MSDVARAAEQCAALVDQLEAGLEDGETVGDVMLLCEVVTDDGASYIQYRCSSERPIIQIGMLSWAQAAATKGHDRVPGNSDDEDDEQEDEDG